MYDIGIDLGTSAVKLLLLSDEGKVVRTVSRSYPLEFPQPGWSQQNPEDWWNAILDGIPELLKGINLVKIGGIGVAGQMHGLVALDKDNHVIRPAILWNDGRTAEETDYLNMKIGKAFLLENTGNIAFAGFTAPKLLWMRKHEPEMFKRIAKIMLPKDYINFRLTGQFVTDYSDAAGMLLLDVKNKCWSKEMLEICGLSETQMPTLHESYDVIGTLLPQVAEQLHLSTAVTVVAGAGDNAAAAVGTGCLHEGQCNLSLGTSGTVFLPCEQFRMDEINATHAFNHAAGNYHLMGCMLSAASCLKWWTEDICKTTDYEGLQAEIKEENLGKNRVFFLPYLMGERAPHNDPHARGTFIGMTMDTTRADMTQAVLEGVAFAFRDMVESARALGIKVDKSTLCGGGAKSKTWKTILANVVKVELQELSEEQGPGLGGAILSGVGRGEYESLEKATTLAVNFAGSIVPDPELMRLYEDRYQMFVRLYPAMEELFQSINDISTSTV